MIEPASHGGSSDGLDAMVEEFLERHRRGERPTVAEYVRRRPELAPEIREVLDAVVALEAVVPPLEELPEHIGDYRIVCEIGRGGMGVVYEALQESLGRRVALKVLSSSRLTDAKQLARFRREAGAASRLNHPGICTVHDAGVADGIPYIAMGYVAGKPLSALIRAARDDAESGVGTLLDEAVTVDESRGSATRPTLAPREELLRVVRLVEDAARALHVAHEAGIVHRDVKPGNILVASDGRPVICDFGLAQDRGSDGSTLTRSGDVFGTPAYMAPEQLAGRSELIDRRADVYGLGVTLYEVVTLHRPFDGATRDALYHGVMNDEAPDPRRYDPRIPRDLATVIETALQKDRNRRYATAIDFAEDLRRVRAREPIRARRLSGVGRLVRWVQRHPARAALVAVLFVAAPLVTGLVVYAVSTRDAVEAHEERILRQRVEAHLERGCFEFLEGSSERAVEELRAALDLAPASLDAVAALALVLDIQGRIDEALALFEAHAEAVRTYPVLDFIRRDVIARRDGTKARLDDRPPAPRTALGWFFLGLIRNVSSHRDQLPVQHRGVADAMRNAALSAPSPRRLYHFELAHAAGHTRDPEFCLPVVQALRRLWPDSEETWKWIGWALEPVDPAQALGAYGKARSEAFVLRGQARAADAAGRFIEAEQWARKLLETHGERGPDLGLLASPLIKLGRWDEAEGILRRGIAMDPANGALLTNLVAVLARGGRDAEALPYAERATARLPTNATAWNNLANACLALGRYPEARAAVERGLALDDRDFHLHFNRGVVVERLEGYAEAIPAYRRCIELNPQYASGHARLGKCLRHAERFAEAAPVLRKAAALDPSSQLAHYELGVALMFDGQALDAVAALERACALRPDDPAGHRTLSRALCRAARYREGLAAFERAGQLGGADGDDAEERLRKITAWADAERELEAIDAGAAVPDDPDHLVRLAGMAYKQGRSVLVTRLFAVAFARQPELLVDPRVDHAVAALRAAARASVQGPVLDAQEPDAVRTRALGWLQTLLDDRKARADAGTLRATRLIDEIESWGTDPELAPLRDAERLEFLPADTRARWHALWRAIDAFLADLDD